MGAPQTTNPVASVVNSVEAVAFKALEAGAVALIVADVPFLGLPVVKQLLDAVVSYVGGKFSVLFQTASTFAIIDVQTSIEESGVSKTLAAVIAAEKSGDPDAIAKAIAAYQAAQSNLAHSDGSATPSA